MAELGFHRIFSTRWYGVIMSETLARAARLLDDVHAALQAHDYAALPALTAALTVALDDPGEKLDMKALQTIRRKADRNASTLLAVQGGIRAALRRLDDIRSVSNGLVTYDRSGRRQEQQAVQGLAARF